MNLQNIVKDTKIFNLSTEVSSGCNVLNSNPNYKSYFTYNIGELLNKDNSIAYIHFSVPFAVIPNSFYNVNYTNNTLVITVSGIATTYSLTRGNYNVNTFITMVLGILGGNWNIVANTITNILTITNSIDFTLGGISTCDYIFGFSGDTTSTAQSLTLPRCCNFLPLPRILLRCSEFSNATVASLNGNSNDIIATIPNTTKNTAQIIYYNTNDIKSLVKVDRLSSFTLRITDDKNNLINFNGVSSYITFQFDIYRFYNPNPLDFRTLVNTVGNNQIEEE